jgi:hypothetical protein
MAAVVLFLAVTGCRRITGPGADAPVAGSPSPGTGTAGKQLIEFGWDEPDTRFMRDHIAQLQASPFDGCVFHVGGRDARGHHGEFTWNAWGGRRFAPAEVESARQDLVATDFGRFRSNFLRVNVTPGDLDWFADHSAVMANLELAARLARDGGCPGILLDTEPYMGALWDYRAQVRYWPHTWDELAAQVRMRGQEAIRALERGYPGLTIMFTYAWSMPLEETAGGRRRLADVKYGLLAPFLDGMLSAASDGVVFVDGHEQSYPYREPGRFAAKADSMRRGVQRITGEPERYARQLSVGFGIWLDYDWRHRGWYPDDPQRNYFTPEAFGVAVRAALSHADRYVWIYSETPRWWTAEGGTRALPAAYDSVLRAVRPLDPAPSSPVSRGRGTID